MTRPAEGGASRGEGAEAIDPDVDLHVPAQRTEPQRRVLAVVAAGGAAGASARYAVGLLWPAAPGAFPWGTLWINAVGCALIGVLMVLISEGGRSAHPLVRPFLGVGVLGGFTTFSTYAVDFERLLDAGEAGTALAYAGLTVVAALGAVLAAARLTRLALGDRRERAAR
ncbi:CrcB family protein [Streptomyces sp. NPDC051555]|uniref:CrcB family protein n=1 Tax=Streptomyces sp. NPDC051555 TaxID=3365657 RepID=UPI0037B80289